MTLEQTVNAFDQAQPNDFTRAEKCRWLSELDGQLWDQILSHRENAPARPVYDADTPADTPLLAPDAYGGLYQVYLSMQANRLNGEIARYNQDAAIFNQTLQALQYYWIRTRASVCTATLTL